MNLGFILGLSVVFRIFARRIFKLDKFTAQNILSINSTRSITGQWSHWETGSSIGSLFDMFIKFHDFPPRCTTHCLDGSKWNVEILCFQNSIYWVADRHQCRCVCLSRCDVKACASSQEALAELWVVEVDRCVLLESMHQWRRNVPVLVSETSQWFLESGDETVLNLIGPYPWSCLEFGPKSDKQINK